MKTLISIEDIDGKIVWINPAHIVEVKAYSIATQTLPPVPCGTAIWLSNGNKVLVRAEPDDAALAILEAING